MSDAAGGAHWLTEWVTFFSGISLLGCGLGLWLWRVAKTTVTKEEGDMRYALRGVSYSKDEADARFANRETCALQHTFLSERFKAVEDRVARESAETRNLIQHLHDRRDHAREPHREDDPDGSDFR